MHIHILNNKKEIGSDQKIHLMLKHPTEKDTMFGASVTCNSKGVVVGGFQSSSIAILLLKEEENIEANTIENNKENNFFTFYKSNGDSKNNNFGNDNLFNYNKKNTVIFKLECDPQFVTIETKTDNNNNNIVNNSTILYGNNINNKIKKNIISLGKEQKKQKANEEINFSSEDLIKGHFGTNVKCTLEGQSVFVSAPYFRNYVGSVFVLLNSMKCPKEEGQNFGNQIFNSFNKPINKNLSVSENSSSTLINNKIFNPEIINDTLNKSKNTINYNKNKNNVKIEIQNKNKGEEEKAGKEAESEVKKSISYELKPEEGCDEKTKCHFGTILDFDESQQILVVTAPGGNSSLVNSENGVLPDGASKDSRGVVFRYFFNGEEREDKDGLRSGKFSKNRIVFEGGGDDISFSFINPSQGIFFLAYSSFDKKSLNPNSTVFINLAQFVTYSQSTDIFLIFIYVIIAIFVLLMILIPLIAYCYYRRLRRNQNNQMDINLDNNDNNHREFEKIYYNVIIIVTIKLKKFI